MGKHSANGRKGADVGHDLVVAPSILSADFARLGEELARCRRAGARWIHVDVMDGHFVPNLTLGPPLLRSCRAAEPKLFFDVHLMLENPMDFAEAFRDAGASLITIHAEASRALERDLKRLKSLGVQTGVAIRPATPVSAIAGCLELADLALVMTVEPGFGGQPLIPSTLNKVRQLDLLRREKGLKFRLEVDGGITQKTAPLALAAGADVLVAGSAVFGGEGSVRQNIEGLRAAGGRPAPKAKAPARKPARSRG